MGIVVALTVARRIGYICPRRLSDVAGHGRQLRAAKCCGPSGGVARTRMEARQGLGLPGRRQQSARSAGLQRLFKDKE